MSATGVALLSLVAWSILMVLSLGVYRTLQVRIAGRAANSFNASGEDLGPLGQRLTRAHANCYENIPLAAAVMLYAIAVGQTALTDPLAYFFLAARIAQSVTHILSTSNAFVLIRFGFFIVQMTILAIWILRLTNLV